jgi:hypothetical protein
MGRENVRDREIGLGEVSPPCTRESRSAPRFEASAGFHPPILSFPLWGRDVVDWRGSWAWWEGGL